MSKINERAQKTQIHTELEAQIEEAVRAAGKMMLREYGKINAVGIEIKPGDSNFVTETDVNIQKFLENRFSGLIPGVGFLAEEEGQDGNSLGDGYVFVIDPIDGTTNFMHDYARSAVSAALLKNKEPVYGAVYDPYLDEFYYAVKGKGAYCNGKKISVVNRPADRSVIGVGTSPYNIDEFGKRSCDIIFRLLKKFADVRRQGSAALETVYVACGRSDAYTELKISPWDYAAGYLIASEAGAVTSDADGKPLGFGKPTSVIFSAPGIYDDVLNLIKETK